jgi:hypothetical protein
VGRRRDGVGVTDGDDERRPSCLLVVSSFESSGRGAQRDAFLASLSSGLARRRVRKRAPALSYYPNRYCHRKDAQFEPFRLPRAPRKEEAVDCDDGEQEQEQQGRGLASAASCALRGFGAVAFSSYPPFGLSFFLLLY